MPQPQPPPEPTLLIIGVMVVALVGWLAFMALAAWVHRQGGIVAAVGGLLQAARSGQARRRRIPLRGKHGRLMGSASVRASRSPVRNDPNEGERRSADRSAPERAGTTVPDVSRSPAIVPDSVLTVPEMLMITAALTRGVAPSEIAKGLPGYSGERYKVYMEKVKKTQAVLAEIGAPEVRKEAPEAKTA